MERDNVDGGGWCDCPSPYLGVVLKGVDYRDLLKQIPFEKINQFVLEINTHIVNTDGECIKTNDNHQSYCSYRESVDTNDA